MVTFASLNIGMLSESKICDLIDVIDILQPDILGLQEVPKSVNGSTLEKIKNTTGLTHHVSGNISTEKHRALLVSHFPAKSQEAFTGFVNSGVIAQVLTPFGPLSVASIHLAPQSEDTRLREISSAIDSIKKRRLPAVILGDFNSIAEGDPVEYDGVIQKPVSNEVDILLKSKKFIDSGKLSKRCFSPTVISTRDEGVEYRNLRLDYIYLSEALKSHRVTYSVYDDPALMSSFDHFPVTVKIH